jgi:bifunctional ADP-heptose synthase (sugar kinase/adenylyltransferase)
VRGVVSELSRVLNEPTELVVGLNSDDYILKFKRSRPTPAVIRAAAVLETGLVDRVLVFEEDDPCEFIRRERPMAHFVGEEYRETAVEADLCRDLGVRLEFVPRVGDWSTTVQKGKYNE